MVVYIRTTISIKMDRKKTHMMLLLLSWIPPDKQPMAVIVQDIAGSLHLKYMMVLTQKTVPHGLMIQG